MAVTKTIVKRVRQQAVIKFVGDGQANVDLDADLKTSDETFLGYANTNVMITGMVWSTSGGVGGPITIKRPSTGANVIVLWGTDNWSLTQSFGFYDPANTNANINITMPSDGGTLYLTVSKKTGYREPQLNLTAPN